MRSGTVLLVSILAGLLAFGCGEAAPDGDGNSDGASPNATGTERTTNGDGAPLTKLRLEFPEPVYKETPKDVHPKYKALMEKPPKGPPPIPEVPEGVENLALKKPVATSGEPWNAGGPEVAVDGKKNARVDEKLALPTGPQWIRIDLGKPHAIYAIAVWHDFDGQRTVFHDVIVEVSNDPDFEDGVTTLYNNDHDNSAGLGVGTDKYYWETHFGRVIPANGVRALYVRSHQAGTVDNEFSNQLLEIEVWGLPE